MHKINPKKAEAIYKAKVAEINKKTEKNKSYNINSLVILDDNWYKTSSSDELWTDLRVYSTRQTQKE